MLEQQNSNGTPEPCPENASGPSYIPTREDIIKNGFYYYALNEQERVFYRLALENKGLTHEIALLQAKIEYFALIYPLNLKMIIAAANALKGLMKVHYSLFEKDGAVDISQKVGEFINSLCLPPETLKGVWDKAHSTS